MSERVKGELVSNIPKKKNENEGGPKHGQRQRPTAEKKEGRMDEAQGTKGKLLTTSSTKHQKGRKYIYIYMSNIYKEENMWV